MTYYSTHIQGQVLIILARSPDNALRYVRCYFNDDVHDCMVHKATELEMKEHLCVFNAMHDIQFPSGRFYRA